MTKLKATSKRNAVKLHSANTALDNCVCRSVLRRDSLKSGELFSTDNDVCALSIDSNGELAV